MIKDFFTTLTSKLKKVPKVQLIGSVVIIILTIMYILSFFTKDKPNPHTPVGPICNINGNDPNFRCEYGQVCQTQCSPNPQCSEPNTNGQKYYCDLKKYDIDCGPDKFPYLNNSCGKSDSKNIRCISKPKTGFSDNGQQYQSLIPSPEGDDCTWLSGFTKDECKLMNTDGILYSDCINNLNTSGSEYSFTDKLVPDAVFKCGYPNGPAQGGSGNFLYTPSGQDSILSKTDKPVVNTDIFTCDKYPKSSFTAISNENTWDTIGKKSNKKLIKPDGTISSVQNQNDICGVHTSNGQIDGYMQTIDCGSGGKENTAWENYYTTLNCDSNGKNVGSNICDVPCWMFKSQSKDATGQGSSCSGTDTCTISGSFSTQCLWNKDECDSAQFSFDKMEQSCNIDSSGCSTKLDSNGTILVSTTSDGINCVYPDKSTSPVVKGLLGCRPNGKPWHWNGSECIPGKITNSCISSVNFDIDYRGDLINIKSIDITINDPKVSIQKSNVTFNVLIYKINESSGMIDTQNQVYVISNNNNVTLSPNGNTLILKGTISDDIINFPNGEPPGSLKKFTSFTSGNRFFMGISINIGNLIINSVEYASGLNKSLSNSKNIFKI